MFLRYADPSDINDVRFCMEIRNNPDNHKYFHKNFHITEEAQIGFMKKEPYFYLIIEGGNRAGTISLYNIHGNVGVWGRLFILPQYRFSSMSSLAEALTIKKAFDELGLEILLCDIVQTNTVVIKMHENFGFKTYEERDGVVYMRLDKQNLTPFYHRIHKRFVGDKYQDFWRLHERTR